MGIQTFRGIKLLSGMNTYPGSGPISSHEHEIRLFDRVLDNVTTSNPVMIEAGCHWALWSLMFRQRFSSGRNILIELGKRALLVGQKNFELNRYSCSSYFGGLFVEESGSMTNRAADLEYDTRENDHLVEHIATINTDTMLVGNNIEFRTIADIEKLGAIDIFHMDIQGSESKLVPYLLDNFKVLNYVVATHSSRIHDGIVNQLKAAGFEIIDNERFGSVGGDGYIYARL
jgi:hypothetical protein